MGNQESQDKFEKGDIIKRKMPNSGGLAYHYGVSMGNGRVIHQTKNGGIQECSLEEFAGGSEVEISKENVRNSLPPDEIAKSAQNLYKKREDWGDYDLLTNNCEHFAIKCATGNKCSSQVQKAHTIAKGTGMAIQIGAHIIEGMQNRPMKFPQYSEYKRSEELFSEHTRETPRKMDIPSLTDLGSNDNSYLSKLAYEDPLQNVESYQSKIPSLWEMDFSPPTSNQDVWSSISSDNMRNTVLENASLFKS